MILYLVLMVASEIFACILVINKRNRLISASTGPEVGVQFSVINIIEVHSEKSIKLTADAKMIFFDIHCGECKMILDAIKKGVVKQYYVITTGSLEEVKTFAKKNNYFFPICFIVEEEMYSHLSILSFPFFITLKEGKVGSKSLINLKELKAIEDEEI